MKNEKTFRKAQWQFIICSMVAYAFRGVLDHKRLYAGHGLSAVREDADALDTPEGAGDQDVHLAHLRTRLQDQVSTE